MSKANDQWFDAMQRAFSTQEDCTCQSEKGRYGPHDDDCPTTLLREELTHWQPPEDGRLMRWTVAFGDGINKVTGPVAKWMLRHLGIRWSLVLVALALTAWIAGTWGLPSSGWMWLLSLPFGMLMGGMFGSLVWHGALVANARRELEDL